MGYWFNNFLEFERKQNKPNRLILNLRYVSSNPDEERNVKVYVHHNVIVPSNFLIRQKAEEVLNDLKNDETLGKFNFTSKNFGKFEVLQAEVPNEASVLHKLPKAFQTGNYDRLLRFSGFFPDRKVSLDSIVLEKIGNNDEVELSGLGGIEFGEFLSEKEIRDLPYVIIDIEKPLWKKPEEKEMIDMKEKLLRKEMAFERKKEITEEEFLGSLKRKRILGRLERMFDYDLDGTGRINLSDEKFKADVSFVGTIWGRKEEIVKELYVIDSRKEIEGSQHNGFSILRFDNERELIRNLTNKMKERKPVVSFGHNQVYDITQLKFAADDSDIMFDPAVKNVKPKRDFVRVFLQRLREDLIYVDTLWMGKIFYPYLNQKRFKTNHKLESLARFLEINFSKSLTHDELREVELNRLSGGTEEIRKKAAKEMVSYSCSDLDVTKNIIERINPFSLLVAMKGILPFCTYSEIAFSPNCINKLHEYKHFTESRNLPFHGYKQKERQDKLQIFKKRFPSLKIKRLRSLGLEKAKNGKYDNVAEYYVPLEEGAKSLVFSHYPKLGGAYAELKEKEASFAFLQYFKTFLKDIFTDYYFTTREKSVYLNSLRNMGINDFNAESYFEIIEKTIDYSKLSSLRGSFKFLKNHFRSIYSALDTKKVKELLPTKNNLEKITYPHIMSDDADLFLLRENAEKLREGLSEFESHNLSGFLKNFENYESITEDILTNFKDSKMPPGILYSYIYKKRFEENSMSFLRRYKFNHQMLYDCISKVYSNLSNEISDKKLKFLDNIGDYIFVQGKEQLKNAIKIRDLDNFRVE